MNHIESTRDFTKFYFQEERNQLARQIRELRKKYFDNTETHDENVEAIKQLETSVEIEEKSIEMIVQEITDLEKRLEKLHSNLIKEFFSRERQCMCRSYHTHILNPGIRSRTFVPTMSESMVRVTPGTRIGLSREELPSRYI